MYTRINFNQTFLNKVITVTVISLHEACFINAPGLCKSVNRALCRMLSHDPPEQTSDTTSHFRAAAVWRAHGTRQRDKTPVSSSSAGPPVISLLSYSTAVPRRLVSSSSSSSPTRVRFTESKPSTVLHGGGDVQIRTTGRGGRSRAGATPSPRHGERRRELPVSYRGFRPAALRLSRRHVPSKTNNETGARAHLHAPRRNVHTSS